jgi:hypothetical protein
VLNECLANSQVWLLLGLCIRICSERFNQTTWEGLVRKGLARLTSVLNMDRDRDRDIPNLCLATYSLVMCFPPKLVGSPLPEYFYHLPTTLSSFIYTSPVLKL